VIKKFQKKAKNIRMTDSPQKFLHLQKFLTQLPKTAGVYEMRNENDETLYVGKAKNLKSRVKSYFLESANHSPRIQKLVEKVHHIEWTQTSSEVEALILETNLIKEKNPKFNILMRDDKNFSYIKVNTQEDFPKITLTRRVLKDKAKYFGPKTSSSSVRKTIDLLQDIFHFRSSNIEITEVPDPSTPLGNQNKIIVKAGNQKYPCLNYHLNKCDAPCIGNISREKYHEKVNAALSFLKGNTKEILQSVKEKMTEYAKLGKFELAAKMRDKMLAIENISEKQIISAPDEFSADIIGVCEKFGHAFFHLFSLREGKIINSETFSVRLPKEQNDNQNKAENENNQILSEAYESFLRSHPARVADSPKTIICDEEFFDAEQKEIWEDFFLENFSHKTEISLPQKGKRKKLLQLAKENAESYAKRHSASFIKHDEDKTEVLEILQKKLAMSTLPKRIECYDISHFSGQKTVASMVVMEDGKTKNSDYRSFNISTLKKGEIDDFASLQEAVSRRLARLPEITPENWEVKKIKTKRDFSHFVIPEFFESEYEQKISGIQSSQEEEKGVGADIIRQEENNTYLLPLFSEVFFDQKNPEKKSQKKIEASFYGFFLEKKQKNTLLVRKNILLKTAEIYVLNNGEENCSQNPVENRHVCSLPLAQIQFLITQTLQKLKCEEYKIFAQQKEIQDFIESLGFTQISPEKFVGKYHSPKNDSFSSIPDLMVIDGGKGQLSSVAKVLIETPWSEKITLCSLAKREEEIFIFRPPLRGGNGGSKPSKEEGIILTEIQKNSPEGHLLQEIRDEAHRFAITKNRVGRGKESMKSMLDDIRGLGPKTKKILKEKGGVVAIRQMSDEELLTIVSPKVLQQLREKL
jgi:excinuclease ABC subunit C